MPAQYLPWILAAPVRLLARCLYRIKVMGAGHLPEGGALLLANHLSYADVVVLQIACPRPIRFVGYAELPRTSWFFRIAFELTGTIPVSPANALEATRKVTECLQRGEYVLLFPEGSISRTGQLMKIQRGFEVMARKAGVPVVPVVHDGLWGSVFSFSDNTYLFKYPRVRRTHVCVVWGEPLAPKEATTAVVRQALLDLGYQAFTERPQLKRHLGRELIRRLARRPGKLEFVDRTAGRKPLSAGELLAAAAALSRHLRRTVAARRIGVVLPPGAGATIVNLAAVCAGKVPVNLNFTAGRAALESSLRVAEIDTVITASAMQAKLPNFPWPGRTLDLQTEMKALGGKRALLPWLVAAWVLPNQWIASLLQLPKYGDREEAGLIFTSGSAGEPKGVVLSHRNILANCWQVASLSILPESAIMLACLPMFHSFGFTVTLWYPMLRGCRVVSVPSPLETGKIVEAIREEKVSVFVGAPTFLRPVIRKATSADLRTLEVVVSGAEKLPMDLYETYLEKFQIEIMQGYGLTETSPVSNVNQPDPAIPTPTAERQAGRRRGTVGRMMPGMTARILNPDTKEEQPVGEAGIVAFRGDNIFSGYLHDAAKTATAFHHGWFVTGDLGRFDEDGFLVIEGRLSRFSKIGGEMVPHGTIEARIVEAFGLDETEGYAAVVMGLPDAAKGEQLVLLTTREELTAEAVRLKLSALGLPNLWMPKLVHRVAKIPVLGTGKLDLKAAKELAMLAVGSGAPAA